MVLSASKLVCGLLSQRYAIHVLLYNRHDILSGALVRDSDITLASCPRRLIVHRTIPTTQDGFPLAPWLLQPNFQIKVLFSVQEDRSLLEGLFSTRELVDANITRIYIPLAQYAYTDWIGSLSIDQLQSVYIHSCVLHSLLIPLKTGWHTPQITFSIITHNRPQSLNRLLQSLSSSLYFGDDADLNVAIHIDSSADPETKRLAQEFSWLPESHVKINQRIVHGGLLPAIVESWYPHGNNSYGVLLEDDVELSPLFYAWIKMAILKYRYRLLLLLVHAATNPHVKLRNPIQHVPLPIRHQPLPTEKP